MSQEMYIRKLLLHATEVWAKKKYGGGGGAIAPSAPMLPMPICNYSIY